MGGTNRRRRLKYVATINDETLSEGTDPDFHLQYVDIGNVDSGGTILNVASYDFADAPSRARRIVRDGDVIISTVRTYLQAIAPISQPPDNLIVSTGFAVIRPRTDLLVPGFCKYALRESTFLAEVEMRSVGVSYPAINASDIGDIAIYVPPLSQQRAIAKYLDREVAVVDALMTVKRRLLELLAVKRATVICAAITRGLDLDAPVRDSGIEWLGRIPQHWEIERAKWLFREIDERTEDDDGELLTVSHVTGVTPRSEKTVHMFEAETTAGYKRCCSGDLVINTLWAWMGAMGIAPVDGIVSPAYNVYRPGPRLEAEFIDLLVRLPIFAEEVTRFSKGVWSSRLRLYPQGFFEVFFPVPPLREQREIALHLHVKIAEIEGLRSATERSIALLKERRAALIAAGVTGELIGTQQ